jgi:hypothetical protein
MMGIIRVADPSENTPPVLPVNAAPADGATGLSTSPLLEASPFNDSDADDRHASSQWLLRLVESGEVTLDTGEDAVNLTQLRVQGLIPSTTYSWQVRYRDDRGAWSSYSTATTFTVANSVGDGSGLTGNYFVYNAKKAVPKRNVATRIDPVIDFEWGLAKPHPSAPANNFYITWEGSIVPEFSEEYRIRVAADGGVQLWVNEQLIIDDPVDTKFALYRSGTINLSAGIPAAVRLQYFDTKANASVRLRWSSPSQPLEVIPQVRLYPTPQ